MAHWVVMLVFIVIGWIIFDVVPGFSGSLKYQLTADNLIGGVLLGFMGFAIGYLPFTLFFEQHKEFLSSTLMVETYHW